jgi:hypothetical protein
MGVNTNTNETYDVSTIREDLQNALISISPTETPFMTAIGRKKATNTYFEWPVIDLAAPVANRVIEGEAAPANDVPNNQKDWQTTHKLVIKLLRLAILPSKLMAQAMHKLLQSKSPIS